LIHVPASADSTKPLPLVLVLHGGTQSATSAERMSRMSELADQEKFLAVYPSGTGTAPTWNSGNCCGYAQRNNVDDVAFIRAVIDQLKRDYSVDPKRIFATGISNGGMMSYRLACELSEEIAAIAPVEGAQNLDCRPSSPVSVLVFHGTADRLVPFDGGTSPYQVGPHRTDSSVPAAVKFWIAMDGCSATPERKETPQLHTAVYSGCKDGTGIALYAIQGGRHMWPGHALSGNDVPATQIIWKFFAQHPKP
jgi:polyhydroxybutyrate depolymerase